MALWLIVDLLVYGGSTFLCLHARGESLTVSLIMTILAALCTGITMRRAAAAGFPEQAGRRYLSLFFCPLHGLQYLYCLFMFYAMLFEGKLIIPFLGISLPYAWSTFLGLLGHLVIGSLITVVCMTVVNLFLYLFWT